MVSALADRYEYDEVIEGVAIMTGTWTGGALRVEHQVPAAQPDDATQVFQDRAPRTLRFHWTRREAEEVRNHLSEHWAGWNICGMGIIGDHVEARLTRVLPDMAAWMETLPAGILASTMADPRRPSESARRSLCLSPCACPASTS